MSLLPRPAKYKLIAYGGVILGQQLFCTAITFIPIMPILSCEQRWAFFGRRQASGIKPYGEVFAVRATPFVFRMAKRLRDDYTAGFVNRCIEWDPFWRCIQKQDKIQATSVPAHERFIDIDDETEVFDTLRYVQRFLRNRRTLRRL